MKKLGNILILVLLLAGLLMIGVHVSWAANGPAVTGNYLVHDPNEPEPEPEVVLNDCPITLS